MPKRFHVSRGPVACALVALMALGGCGRLGYDLQPEPDAGPDTGSAECPSGSAEIAGLGTRVCIDTAQSDTLSWVEGSAFCDDAGRRLCTDAEWLEGCTQHSGSASLDMVDDWEWVADIVSPGVAGKRGGDGTCEGMSSHEIDTDAYGIRCCLDL